MKDKLIVALDVNSFKKAKELIDRLSPHVNIFKVGSELFVAEGPRIISYISGKRKKVFLDLKFYDIPNTVEKAVLAAAKQNVFMLTLHTTGGLNMLEKARNALKGKKRKPLLLGVTVLTSMKTKDTQKKVVKLAKLAKKAGLDGIVCSAKETRQVKRACGSKLLVVNPGVRPRWAGKDDQKRITTPKQAIKNGADFIVIGRPVTKAEDPSLAVKKILKDEINNE